MGTNTGIGIGIGISFKNNVLGEGKPYLPPEIKDSLKAVVIAYGKTNNDSDRAIVKNLVDPDNPFVISNAAYTEGSGYADKDSPYYGAFVTDGIDDLITSTKTVQEMLGGSNETTVVSMAHFIKGESNAPEICRINQIRRDTRSIRNSILKIGKSGIFGYTYKNGVTTINNILGDKNDCIAEGNLDGIVAPFSVEGYYYNNNSNPLELCSIAWYWTIIANKALTSDQINQVIAYFNLDRTLKPDILCNITKQGITNENHAEFNDKLIDYSGNGRDIQMNNLAWKGGSGIAAKQYETFKDWTSESSSTSIITQIDEFTRIVESTTNGYWVSRIRRDSDLDKVYSPINVYLYQDNNFLVHECKYEVDGVKYAIPINEPVGKGYHKLEMYTKDRYTELPENAENVVLSEWYFPKSNKGSIKYSVIPSHKGGILLDGINDFGKVIGMPVYKDYTFIIDYERISYASSEKWVADVVSKSHAGNQGAFILMRANTKVEPAKQAYSFGGVTSFNRDDFTRALLYQSKYKCGDVDLTVGEGVDSDTLWLGTFRDNDQRFFNGAIYSLMSFPYSMSEFLIERQLKKHKLGTLYPDMVEFRPIVKSNSEYQVVDCYIDALPAVVGNYYPINSKLRIAVTTKGAADEVTSLTVNGVSLGTPSVNGNRFTFNGTLSDKSPQKINITIDEYIRFEDIVQPYPVLLRFNDENGNEVSWGGKFRVGSTITRIGGIDDTESNLLNGLYSISGLSLNGKAVTSSTSIVEKQMVFRTTATWLLDNNEPKVILSPSRLRIPNSSYKILGYIPDISGHGNHGVIHNSAYAEGSGVNEDGSYQFDGVDDFITIPTTVGGKQVLMKVNWQSIVGTAILYDQRTNGGFAIFNKDFDTSENKVPAYRARNIGGSTYIDGILNEYIYASELKDITHNIVELYDPELNIGMLNPKIGSSYLNSNYTQMSLYDFMLFDEISTDDKILELNEYVGIEAKVELPPYYWDTYGKTNFDADRDTIQQRGVAVGDYDITNYNHAYEGMSGYNGYPVVFGKSKTWEAQGTKDGDKYYIYTSNANKFNITQIKISSSLFYTYIKRNGELTSGNKDILSLTLKVTGLDYDKFYLAYYYLKSADVEVRNVINITSDGIYELPKSFASDGSLTETNSYIGLSFIKKSSEIPDIIQNVNVTIEVLPEYENGLVYDGVEDYSENVNVLALTDYTYIFKRTLLNKKYNSASIFKGSNQQSGGGAFICDYNSVEPDLLTQGYSFGAGLYVDSLNADSIVYGTRGSVNGQVITSGNNTDTEGLTIGKWRGYKQMVFYKLILYPKTIPLLQINFLKNLMEKDEIIDLTNPIFIKDE